MNLSKLAIPTALVAAMAFSAASSAAIISPDSSLWRQGANVSKGGFAKRPSRAGATQDNCTIKAAGKSRARPSLRVFGHMVQPTKAIERSGRSGRSGRIGRAASAAQASCVPGTTPVIIGTSDELSELDIALVMEPEPVAETGSSSESNDSGDENSGEQDGTSEQGSGDKEQEGGNGAYGTEETEETEQGDGENSGIGNIVVALPRNDIIEDPLNLDGTPNGFVPDDFPAPGTDQSETVDEHSAAESPDYSSRATHVPEPASLGLLGLGLLAIGYLRRRYAEPAKD